MGAARRRGRPAVPVAPLFPNDLQAYGNNLAATILLVAGLVWHMRIRRRGCCLASGRGRATT